ncbi:putative sugar O-methyltransferase [bacterium]|nr:putative sugar O-methyltransferase [bacterium]
MAERIFHSFRRMKDDQNKVSKLYQPSSLWQNQLDIAYSFLREAYRDQDFEKFHYFLANFGTWKEYTGVESGVLLRQAKTLLDQKELEHNILLNQLKLWKWLTGDRYSLKRLTYPMWGNQAGAYIDGTFIGIGSFFNDVYGEIIERLFNGMERPILGELGGGYGKLARFSLRHLDCFCYVDFDLPETLCLASYYLMKTYPDKHALLYGEEKLNSSSVHSYDLIFMPSWEIESLVEDQIDIFINKNSLGEIEPTAACNYVAQISRATKRYFFHMNHEFIRNHYDDGSSSLLAYEYPVPSEKFTLLMRYPDIGHTLYKGFVDYGADIFFYLYGCK